ncbi:Apolipoprotein D [Frankliniella fusca]|uniref:Apolipoprotein D n=1 Tax=Frankliniella fusca TaxID=407009 RepID=A0AAE1HY13_9NEOP|nr:Apolipoprotein D [Frankliniella fusca]
MVVKLIVSLPSDQGVYNTYVLDSDYTTWALLLHCAEQEGSLRYLSSFILSRAPDLPANVQAYLRDKLTRYAIDLEFMFPMAQDDCDNLVDVDGPAESGSGAGATEVAVVSEERPRPERKRKHPLQRDHRRRPGREL